MERIYKLAAILYFIVPISLYIVTNYLIIKYLNDVSMLKAGGILVLIFWLATFVYDIAIKILKIKSPLIGAVVALLLASIIIKLIFEINILSLVLIIILNITIFYVAKRGENSKACT